jgi:hypothetical protein
MVPISNSDTPAEGPLAVDIDNHRGSVSILVDPKLTEPVVTAKARGQKASVAGQWTAASLATDAGHPVLRVLCTAPPTDDEGTHVDIVVRTPSCAGVRVRTDDGLINLRGIQGAIDAQTSTAGHGLSAIFISTDTALTEPILLHSERGKIEVRMPKTSAGQIQAASPLGTIDVDAVTADLRDVSYVRQIWTGTLNGGKSDLHLIADDGDIVVIVGRR